MIISIANAMHPYRKEVDQFSRTSIINITAIAGLLQNLISMYPIMSNDATEYDLCIFLNIYYFILTGAIFNQAIYHIHIFSFRKT